ncbi:MAG TPA: hypothetical protein DIU15_18470, partial [Deltaproteobacteria bacterium]|nr:hypothetical protein [Deltaproteobacteria bacterium]HCP48030.1 hypothetical protein [Deltaproteobacteria bacterium]
MHEQSQQAVWSENVSKASLGQANRPPSEGDQFDAITESIVSMAQLRFDCPAPVLGENEILDGVAVGLNSLGEELAAQVVSRDRVRSILNALTDALLILSPEGEVRFLNAAAKRLLGQVSESLVGQNLQDFLELPGICEDEDMDILPLGPSPSRSLGRLLLLGRDRKVPVLLSSMPMQTQEPSRSTDYLCLLWGRIDGGLAGGWVPGSDTGRVPFNPALLIEEVVEFHRSVAKARDLELQLEVGAGVPTWLLGARTPLQQVLHALASSALEWTESGTVVF